MAQMSQKTPLIHKMSKLSIISQNIQRLRLDDSKILHLSNQYNISMFQELNLGEDFLFQHQNKKIYKNTPSSRTAIIIEDHIKVVDHSLLTIAVLSQLQVYITDAIIEQDANNWLWLINIYNPSADYQKQILLQNQLSITLQTQLTTLRARSNNKTINIILGGDFNNFVNSRDSANFRSREQRSSESLKKLIKTFKLADIYEHSKLHQIKKNWTNQSTTEESSRRIDRFYISQSMISDKNRFHIQMSQQNYLKSSSTHDSIILEINTQPHAMTYIPQHNIIKNHIIQWLLKIKFPPTVNSTSDLISEIRLKLNFLTMVHKKITENTDEPNYYDHIRTRFHQHSRPRPIKALKASDGALLTSQQDMLLEVTNYYQKLYDGSRGSKSSENIERFINASLGDQLPLTNTESNNLNKPITMTELEYAVTESNTQSAPGVDGIPYGVYKSLFPQIKHILLKEFNQILSSGEIPFNYRTIKFTLIPKPNKDVQKVENYRPIALINTNLKLFSSIINTRLLPFLQKIIGPNQVGFIPERSSFSNITIFGDLLSSLISPQDKPHVNHSTNHRIMLADFEKAFDQISHLYLKILLRKLNFGKMTETIHAILTKALGTICLNNITGPSFPLRNGTLQGNPLSPTIFALALEPFLRAIQRLNKGFSYNHKIQPNIIPRVKYLAYADDVTLFLRDHNDFKNTMKIIQAFEQVSGSKLNKSKSRLIVPCDQIPFQSDFQIDIADNNYEIQYLGVKIGNSCQTWPNTLQKDISTKYYMTNMSSLPISSQIVGYNTYILSKLYYHEIHAPMLPDQIDLLEQSIKNQVNKKLKISMDTLKTSPLKGGYGMVDIKSQLSYRKAKIFQQLFLQSLNPYCQLLRFKLQLAINMIIKQNLSEEEQSIQGYIKTQYWWRLILGDQINIKNKRDSRSILNQVINLPMFTTAEKCAFVAWYKLLSKPISQQQTLNPMNIKHSDLAKSIQDGIPTIYQMEIPKLVMEFEHKQGSKKKRARIDKHKLSTTLTNIQEVTQTKQNSFWKRLHKYQHNSPGYFENIHIFHLGAEQFFYQHRKCHYCGLETVSQDQQHESPELQVKIKMTHFLIQCPLSTELWSRLKIPIPLAWNNLIAPNHSESTIKKIDRYLCYQRKLSRLRYHNQIDWNTSINNLIYIITTGS